MNPPNQPTGSIWRMAGAAACIIQMESPAERLKELADDQSCCIFRVPHFLVEANETAYKPKILSIGPYHHLDGKDVKDSDGGKNGKNHLQDVKDSEGGKDGKNHLQMIQEHKQRYLNIFLSKTQEKEVYLTHLREVVLGLEERIRGSYSEVLKINSKKLVDMMVLDGCFILTLFLVTSDKSWREKYPDDPIFMFRWTLPALRSDLLLLENQVPLFLLQDLLRTSKLFPSTIRLNTFIFKFFGYSIKRSKQFWRERKDLDAKHLLDLIRQTFIPKSNVQVETSSSTPPPQPTETPPLPAETPPPQPPPQTGQYLKLVVSAKKLRLRGIKFKPKESETPLDITLKSGVLEIPLLTFDDFFSSLLINCVAFEQFNVKCTTEMTSYVTFMNCLISTAEDATFLSEKGIIENYYGTGDQVSLFFKNTGKDIAFSISTSYLSDVFEGINKYTSQGYHVQWAGVKYTYFNNPWTFLSSCAALMLLLLTIFQAFFAAYGYFRPPN